MVPSASDCTTPLLLLAKKVFPKDPLDRSAFTEIANEENLNTSNAGVILEYQGVNIYLGCHFNPSILKRCLEVLKEC
jgi:hypothetical protein